MTAGFALVLAARSDVIAFGVAALRADRLAVGIRPAHFFEQTPSLILAHAKDFGERDAPSLCSEEEVRWHHHIRCKLHQI